MSVQTLFLAKIIIWKDGLTKLLFFFQVNIVWQLAYHCAQKRVKNHSQIFFIYKKEKNNFLLTCNEKLAK